MAEKYVGNAPEAVRAARLKAMREKILFARESDGFEVEIPRFRLKKEVVNKLFGDEVEHVHDLEGNVILPDDYMWHCLPPPLKYFVYHRERVELPPDDAQDPWYYGETIVLIRRAPADLSSKELIAWLLKGIERGDERFMVAKTEHDELTAELKQTNERLENVPFMKTNAESEEGMAAERLRVTKLLQKKCDELEGKLKGATLRLNREIARRKQFEVKVQLVRTDEKRKVTDWYAVFGTLREENNAVDLDQWPSVRVFHKMEKRGQPQAFWDDEIDAESEVLQDPELEINMRGIIIQRIKHGKGAFTDWQRGDSYKGDFCEGLRQGNGILYDRVGIYRGEFLNDVRHGKGVQVFANGDVYEGLFENDQIVGTDGVLRLADGSVYEGDLLYGIPHGHGAYRNPRTKESMAGDFVDGMLHGLGVAVRSSGERCEGEFKHGDLHGRGSWRSRKGNTCDGDFECGVPHGSARYVYRRGTIYEGFFHDGERCGPGSMVYGNVTPEFDRTTGQTYLKHDYEYQGTWLAGQIQARNTHVTVYDRLMLSEKEKPLPGYLYEQHDLLGFTTNAKSYSKYPFLHTLVPKEELKRRKRYNRDRALLRREKKTLRKIWNRNKANYKKDRKEMVAIFKRVDRALQGLRNGDYDPAEKVNKEKNKESEDTSPEHKGGATVISEGIGRIFGDKLGAITGKNQTESEEVGREDVGREGDPKEDEGLEQKEEEEHQEEEEDEEEYDDDEYESFSDDDSSYISSDEENIAYYEDSDWFSDEEYQNEDEETGGRNSRSKMEFLPKSIVSNPLYRELRLSLVDILEDPPPRASKAVMPTLKSVLEYYAQQAHRNKMQALLADRNNNNNK